MVQKYYYKSYGLVVVFVIILLILFLVEFMFLTPLIALSTFIPLLPILFFLKSDYLYTIENNCLSIYGNGSKRMTLHIEDIKSAIVSNDIFKNIKIVLISKNNQKINIYIRKEEVDQFISNFQIK